MAKHTKHDEIDLDEDIFGFDQVAAGPDTHEDDEQDLEAIFAAFQAEEEAMAPAPPLAKPPAPTRPALEDELGPAVEEDTFYEVEESKPVVPPAALPTASEPRVHERPELVKAVVASGSVVTKSVLLILLSVTMLNGLVAVVVLQNAFAVRESVHEAKRDISSARDQILDDKWESALEMQRLRSPLVPPDPETHPTFERAAEQIGRGEYASARQGLYSLLSVVDRLEESQRRVVESRAHYLLAQANHLEAMGRLEEEK